MTDYSQGNHPNSLANLELATRTGRPADYETPKQNHTVRFTRKGWEGAQAIAAAHGCTGVSDLLEKLGRGELVIQARESSHR